MNPSRRMVTVGLQYQNVRFKYETDRATRNNETVMGGRYATRRVVLALGAEYAPTMMTLTALTESFRPD
jgi:hypothetical protein